MKVPFEIFRKNLSKKKWSKNKDSNFQIFS